MNAPALAVPAEALERFARELLRAGGLNDAHAAETARVLAWADARGVPSHGVARLPTYLGWLRSGVMAGDAAIHAALELPALAILEGARCPGPAGMLAAVRAAVPLARRCGIGLVLVRNITHTGALGHYTAELARHGMAGWAMAASGPNMGYFGAARAAVSTAPLSIAFPAPAAEPIVFDMAASTIPFGRLEQARKRGLSLPGGAAQDAAGKPTTDVAAAVVPTPLGGPKGSGLALMTELLCSVLAGAPILAPALARDTPQAHRQNGLLVAIDAAQVAPSSDLDASVQALASTLKGLPGVDGGEVLLPGERGWRAMRRHTASGIPLDPATMHELALAASGLQVPLPWN